MWIILTTTNLFYSVGAISMISTLIAEFQVKNYITHNPEKRCTNLKSCYYTGNEPNIDRPLS